MRSPAEAAPRRVTEVGRPEPVDVDGRHRLATAVGLVSFLAVIVIATVGLGAVFERGLARAEVPVVELPRLAGTRVEDAQRRLEAFGLIVDLSYAANERLVEGTVFDQLPPAGARVERGDRVELRVSDGPFGYVVPELFGDTVLDATRELAAGGMAVEVEEAFDEVVPAGVVLRSEPAAGRRVPLQTAVLLAVSKGPAPRVVPAVVDRPAPEALAELGRAGLGLGAVRERYVADVEEGVVLELDPAPGTELARDAAVDVVVSGPPPSSLVPSVIGLRTASAQQVLLREGFVVVVRAVAVEPGSSLIGRVVSQGAPAGERIPPRSDVEILVGRAAAGSTSGAGAGSSDAAD